MLDAADSQERFKLSYDAATYRRLIAGKEVIIHCHHYNSRIQNTIEGAAKVDGKKIISSSAEAVFAGQLKGALRESDDKSTRWKLASALYAHLGYGMLDFSRAQEGTVTASSSHFVEGWNAGFPGRTAPVCSFTEGYIQGALHAITGESVYAREQECMVSGAPQCTFRISSDRTEPVFRNEKQAFDFKPRAAEGFVHSPNIDERKIIDALVQMPVFGNQEGLIPAFGVYLANTPADFYNLVCIRFIEEMTKHNLFAVAKKLLTYDAETCGMNTFRGIMSSAEWDGLVEPMIKEPADRLHGIIAISNGLGWGNWHVREHVPGSVVKLESLNGYEALGYREYRGKSESSRCFMLTGVAAGIMELVYGDGAIEERFGTFQSAEGQCVCQGDPSCSFSVKRV
jgi:predicted hydrocarbon binding protein